MNRSILLGMGVVAGLLLTTARADAGGPFHGHKMKYGRPVFGSPFVVSGVQPMFVQPTFASQGVNPIDVINLINRLAQNPGVGGVPSNISSRLDAMDAKIAALTARVDNLDAKLEENRRTRILVEQHDEVLRRLVRP